MLRSLIVLLTAEHHLVTGAFLCFDRLRTCRRTPKACGKSKAAKDVSRRHVFYHVSTCHAARDPMAWYRGHDFFVPWACFFLYRGHVLVPWACFFLVLWACFFLGTVGMLWVDGCRGHVRVDWSRYIDETTSAAPELSSNGNILVLDRW